MRQNGPTLIDILCPRQYENHPLRAKVTRTIRQPDIDELEKLEGLAASPDCPPTTKNRPVRPARSR